MKKFIVIYHATPEALAQMSGKTPEEFQEGMKPWFAWKEKLGDQLIDLGSPLFGGIALIADGSDEASKKEVAGYSIIAAENMDEAKELLKGHPHFEYGKGCGIEVHECAPM